MTSRTPYNREGPNTAAWSARCRASFGHLEVRPTRQRADYRECRHRRGHPRSLFVHVSRTVEFSAAGVTAALQQPSGVVELPAEALVLLAKVPAPHPSLRLPPAAGSDVL